MHRLRHREQVVRARPERVRGPDVLRTLSDYAVLVGATDKVSGERRGKAAVPHHQEQCSAQAHAAWHRPRPETRR